MNIKEELTKIIQAHDSYEKKDQFKVMFLCLNLVSELQDEKCIIPENVLSDLTNEQQRAVLLLAMVATAQMLQESK